jgi:hypothetical protein
MIDQMDGDLHHGPGVARGTGAARPTREADQAVVTAQYLHRTRAEP